jgi:hypothetical protein
MIFISIAERTLSTVASEFQPIRLYHPGVKVETLISKLVFVISADTPCGVKKRNILPKKRRERKNIFFIRCISWIELGKIITKISQKTKKYYPLVIACLSNTSYENRNTP